MKYTRDRRSFQRKNLLAVGEIFTNGYFCSVYDSKFLTNQYFFYKRNIQSNLLTHRDSCAAQFASEILTHIDIDEYRASIFRSNGSFYVCITYRVCTTYFFPIILIRVSNVFTSIYFKHHSQYVHSNILTQSVRKKVSENF